VITLESSTRKIYPFTILWVIIYLGCIFLTLLDAFPVISGLYLPVFGVGVLLTLLAALEWSVHLPGRKIALVLVLASTAWWLASLLLVRAGFSWRIWHTLNTFVLLIGSSSIGFWLAGEIEKVGHLLPVGILGSLVDIWSVFSGPSKSVGEQVVKHYITQSETGLWHPPPVVEFLILSWPLPGVAFMTPLFGFGDLVFIALFLGSARRFGLPLWRSFFLIIAGLAASFAVVSIYNMPIPALPLICGFFILGNIRSLSLSRKEWIITLGVSGAILLFGFLNWIRSGI